MQKMIETILKIIEESAILLDCPHYPKIDEERVRLLSERLKKDKRIVVKIADTTSLIFKTGSNGKLRVEIASKQTQEKKNAWESMVEIIDGEISISKFGSVRSSDDVVDLTAELENLEPVAKEHDDSGELCGFFPDSETLSELIPFDVPEPDSIPFVEDLNSCISEATAAEPKLIQKMNGLSKKPKEPEVKKPVEILCPYCNRKPTEEDLENHCCSNCEHPLYICPRCEHCIDINPDKNSECPKCKKNLLKVRCPRCSEYIYADTEECPKCNTVLNMSQCPHCFKNLFVSSGLEICPSCENRLNICPRCEKYTSSNPSNDTKCALCEASFKTIGCPKCNAKIYSDQVECSKCGVELKVSQCPHCYEKLSLSNKVQHCPFCRERVYICPRCEEYIYRSPTELKDCPRCDANLKKVKCPSCSSEIYSDLEKCPKCGIELKLWPCPHCHDKIILKKLDCCPRCDNRIRVEECPHCSEKYYKPS